MQVQDDRRPGLRQRRENTRAGAGRGMAWYRIFPVVSLVLMLAVLPAAAADPTVLVTDYTVTPAVLVPGDIGTITFTIKNTATTASEKENTGFVSSGVFESTKNTDINVFIENVHLETNGIEVLTGDFDRVGELGPGQSVPVTFVIRAPYRSGIYFPEAWIDVKDGRSTRYPLMVNVNTDISTLKKPALSVAQSLPERVAPGDDCTAFVTVKNTGLTRAGDVTVTVNSTVKSLVLTTSGRYYTDHLDPSENMTFALHFATDKNTPIGIDPVMLSITYRNPDGTAGEQTGTVGIPVKGRAEIAVSSVTTDPVRPVPGNTFTLIIRVENTGTDKATSVRATLDSPFAGTKNAFIGSIDKDSDAPAVFYLQATEDGAVPANLTISYTDDFGSHAVSEEAMVMTAPASGLALTVIAVLFVCLITGAGYWYFRVRPGKGHAE